MRSDPTRDEPGSDPTPMRERWDVFTRVVDNFGDVGVSWRLARLLAREHGKRVRLWLDDLTVLAKLRPEIDSSRDRQQLSGVEVARLAEPFTLDSVADVVVETFGCDPPAAYVEAMAQRGARPRWINLEYLSAEEWIEGSHALPSPNPRLPLVKHFFFPGFTAKTGGLLREESLLRRRDEFQADEGAQAAFWRSRSAFSATPTRRWPASCEASGAIPARHGSSRPRARPPQLSAASARRAARSTRYARS